MRRSALNLKGLIAEILYEPISLKFFVEFLGYFGPLSTSRLGGHYPFHFQSADDICVKISQLIIPSERKNFPLKRVRGWAIFAPIGRFRIVSIGVLSGMDQNLSK
jgi:hypothetical protein